MSTDASTSMNTAKTVPTPSVGTDSIRRKINRTRRSVKLAELVAGILLFAAGSLLFLLTLAVVDHWIVGLNFAARLMAFLVYVVAAVGFLWIYVAPLLVHSINPMYAAKMIEQGQPTLKNSLLNFMFLSQNHQGTHKAVLDAVENQAATDISSLSLEHLVDYSKAIRIGYILAALAVLFGLYTVLSPKNPMQTAARIAMPWNDIARPSRVKIVDVQPGDVSIYQGQEVDVIVKLHDVADGDLLEVIYSTRDGQIVDQAIPLEPGENGFEYRATLSTSDNGIQQDLTYRVEAGDAATRDFEVTTLEAPSIDVASLRYDFPSYTQEAPWEQQGDGHIRALEGTMVTIRAISNRPIKKAYLEFDPAADSPIVSLNTIPLQVNSEEPNKASVRFPLEMNDAGTAGKFRSYQIRFRTDDGVLNPHPVLYHIDVVRDLPPEVEYLEPTASEIELPANRSLDVRLRAIDPDFGIRQLRVSGTISQEAGPRLPKTIEASLLDQPQSGQVIQSWKLVPKQHKLEVGDIVKLIGIAEDTRTDFAGNVKPNVAQTNPRTIRIVEPVAGDQQGKPEENGSTDDQGDPSDEMSDSNDSGEQGDQQGKGSESGESGDMSEGENGDEENQSDGNSGDSNQDGMKGHSDKPQEGENNSESEDQQSGEGSGSSSKQEQGDENQEQQQGQGSQSQEGEQQSGQPQEGGMGQSQQEGGDQQSQSQANGGKGGEASQASDDQQREQNQSDQTGQPNGSGTGKAGDPNKGGELQQGDASTQPNENSTVERKPDPVAPDGSNDGEAFERIQDYLKDKQKQQGQQPPADNSGKPNPQQQGQGEGTGTGLKPEEGMQDGAGGDSQQNPGDSQGEPSDGQKNQGQGSQQGSQDQSTGQQEGSQPNENGVDNGMKPENSAGGENATGEQKQEGEPGTTDQNDGQSSERDTQNSEQGGSENKGGAVQEDQEANPSSDSERSGDTGKGDNTNSGAGSKANEGDKGSPESSEKANKQGENNMKPDDRESDQQGDQPKSPSNSDKQSNSKGETRGDQSGGGGSGGGQAAKQAGNDSAGSTSAADQGAGAANQQGEGETGKQGGDGPQSDEQTGSSGEQPGDGSTQTNSPDGQESGMQGAESEQGPSDSQQSSDPQQSGTGPGNSAIPQGGGLEGNNAPQNYDGPRVEPGEDAANLEYAKKATDMVLDELKHQDSPDQELLDELGWSKDDFARFMQRWNQMKQAANSEDTAAKQDLNDALRSLGLSQGEDTTRRVQPREAAAAGGSSDTQRGSPPPSFMEQYRAYLKGASQ